MPSASSSRSWPLAGWTWSDVVARLKGYLAYLLDLYKSGWRFRWLVRGLIAVGIGLLAAKAIYQRLFARYRADIESQSLLPEYDYIVVGGGSAGAVVAARLSEDPDVTVLLLEAGGSDDRLNSNIPAAALKLQRDPEVDWCYQTVPQAHAQGNMANRVSNWPRGKMMGGCSANNYMLFVRGAPGDFDAWAALGAGATWAYERVLPYFKKLESVTPETSTVTPSPLRGTDGPMACNLITSPQVTAHAFVDAADASGLCPKNPDYNGSSILGVGLSQYNVRDGKRCSTGTAYIAPALAQHRPNLHVRTHAHVQRVLFSPSKAAIGVAIKTGTCCLANQPETLVRAREEVILSAGAIGSPQLLELSGVGQRAVLGPLGIPVIADRSGVGESLQDHINVPVFHESTVSTLSSADETLGNLYEYAVNGRGRLTSNSVEALGWIKTAAHGTANIHPSFAHTIPDVQFHFLCSTITPAELAPFNFNQQTIERITKLYSGPVKFMNAIMVTLLHPHSVGSVHIASRNALDAPIIDPNYLSRPEDVASMVAACIVAMKIYEQPAIRKVTGRFLGDEFVTGNPFDRHTQPDLFWEHYIRHQAMTLYHPTSTCKMGDVNDPSSVVGPDLSVIGVSRLRVVDASVMPTLTSGNTNVPTIMIGEKAADLIKQARKERRAAKTKTVLTPTNNRSKL